MINKKMKLALLALLSVTGLHINNNINLFNTANAGTASTNFLLNASLVSKCDVSMQNTLIMAFDGSSSIATNAPTVTIPVQTVCTKGTAYTLMLSTGNGTLTNRYLVGQAKADKLYYTAYTDSSQQVIWGDGTSGTGTIQSIGTGSSVTSNMVVKVASGQYVTPDTYSDTLIVSVNY